MVVATHDNATYILCELDGTIFKIPIASKRIKALKKNYGRFHSHDIAEFDINEEREVENTKSKREEDGNLHEDEDEWYLAHIGGCACLEEGHVVL